MPILYTETHTNKKTSSPQQHRPRTNPPASVAHHPAAIIQHAQAAPESLSAADVLQLQRTIGNRAVVQLMYGIGRISSSPAQRWELEEEEELLQGKFTTECLQCQAPEEEELLQGKSEATQRQGPEEEEEEEEEELMQGKFVSGLTGTLQAKEEAPSNRTGMPDHLKSGLENISGMDLSGVRVHYNSPNPKQLNALAYTQGQEIHVGPGQEKHLLHEGWHAVQQMQGRVKPTMQLKDGVPVNDDEGLEREADVMGEKAMQMCPLGKRAFEFPIYHQTAAAAFPATRQPVAAAHRMIESSIQRKPPEAADFEIGSAAANKALSKFRKNQYWEIGFRKYSKVNPGTFDVDRENDQILKLQTIKVREGIPINHSIEGIAVSRNADFVLDVLRAGSKKVVSVIAIPPDFGIDLEAEYLKHYRQDRETNPTGRLFPEEYEENKASRLSMEVTLQQVPAGCVYGWIERNLDPMTKEPMLTWVTNPKRACKDIAAIDDQDRFAELMSKVKEIGDVKLVGFP